MYAESPPLILWSWHRRKVVGELQCCVMNKVYSHYLSDMVPKALAAVHSSRNDEACRTSFLKLEGAACANFIASTSEVLPDSFSSTSIV
jgi:hypothetical protein